MDRVVDWILNSSYMIQCKLATEFGSFAFLVTAAGYKCQFMCRDGS